MGVLREIRALPGAIKSLTFALERLAAAQAESAPAVERLEALELSRHQFEAEIDGMVLKAESRYKAANASEARARTLERHNERLTDPFDPDSREVEETPRHPDLLDNGQTREAEGMHPLHLGVETSPKALALRAKYGL